MNITLKKLSNSNLILFCILILNFSFRIVIYFNTKLFYFSDYKAHYDGIETIYNSGSIDLIIGNFAFLQSYIGYFFKYILGSIDYYFIFNCILGTLTSFLVYLIVKKLTKNSIVSCITVILHLLYTENLCWSSIFYTPILMIFILSLIVLLVVHYFDKNKITINLLIILSIVLLINFSFLIKGEMKYFYFLFILFGLLNFKKKDIFFKFVILGVILFGTTKILYKNEIFPRSKTVIPINDFRFFGHTLYGGDGGDGAFIYEENEKKYYQELDNYCISNNISDSLKYSREVRNAFQSVEIKKFITQHPFQWVKLQAYKFFRFFGVVPEGNSAKILITGLFKGNMYLTAIFLVLPFSLMVLSLILLSDYKVVIRGLKNPKYLIMFLFVGYYIAGSVFYGQYQERYRMPLMVCFLIPYLAYTISNFKWNKGIIKEKMINIIVVLIIVIIWGNQLYYAVVVHKDRYLNQSIEVLSQ